MRISDWSSDVCSSDLYDGLQLAFVLLRPGAIAPAVRGNGVRASARLDGAFAMPTVDYRADAKTLAFNDIVVETLSLAGKARVDARSEEHTSELQSLMRISYAVFCLKKKKTEKSNINKL